MLEDRTRMIHIGTAGYAYKDWEGPVYPRPKPTGFDPLVYLSGFVHCIEMNVTFYRVPTAEMVARWVHKTADRPRFTFTFKLYRGLTHGEEPQSLPPFLEALEPCRTAGRLGAILLQFPHFFRNTQPSRVRLSWLAKELRGWPCAVELRHNSWLVPAALDFLRRLELNFCNIDICATETSIPPGSWTTGPVGYVRLHGRNRDAWFDKRASVEEKYNYLYDAAELQEWAARIRDLARKTEQTFVITNNHFGGKAVANAFQLARLLKEEPPEPPPQLVERYPQLSS